MKALRLASHPSPVPVIAAVYDFMGFFPSLAYIEIATRADRRPGDVQFLFGTRQSF